MFGQKKEDWGILCFAPFPLPSMLPQFYLSLYFLIVLSLFFSFSLLVFLPQRQKYMLVLALGLRGLHVIKLCLLSNLCPIWWPAMARVMCYAKCV